MLHHLRCPSCFHDLDLPHEAEQPGRLLTCPSCGWEARMWQWVSESRNNENRIKMTMKQIQKNEIYPILQRSVGDQMCFIIQILSGERSSIDTEEYDITSMHDAYLDALWEIYDLSLFLDFTGNLDAPLP